MIENIFILLHKYRTMNAYIYVDIKILVNLGILVGPYLTPHGSIVLY